MPIDSVDSVKIVMAEMESADKMGERITGSRYATICTTCPDGLPGTTATPWLVKTYGMYLDTHAHMLYDTI